MSAKQTQLLKRLQQAAQSVSSSISSLFSKKDLVGQDANGNLYYRITETKFGNKIERREVKWSQPYFAYDPRSLQPEWRMWLTRKREDPPTEEELAKNAAAKELYKKRVAAVEEQEKLRRFKARSMGAQAHTDRQSDIEAFVSQIGSGENGLTGSKPDQS